MIAEILPNELLLGGIANVLDFKPDRLHQLAIVQCLTEFESQAFLNREEFYTETILDQEKYQIPIHKINIDDSPAEAISQHLFRAVQFIDDQINKNDRTVLVHCNQGVSRSTTVVVAYLMMKKKMRLREALKHVKIRRLRAQPNSGFLESLIELEQSLCCHDYHDEQEKDNGEKRVMEDDPMMLTVFLSELLDEFSSKNDDADDEQQDLHFRQLLKSVSKYSSSLSNDIEKKLNDENLKAVNGKKLYDDLLEESQFSHHKMLMRAFQPIPDHEQWCPPPIQVGIEEFFKLSKIDGNMKTKIKMKSKHGDVDVDNSVDPCLRMTNRKERRKFLAAVFGGEEGKEFVDDEEEENEKGKKNMVAENNNDENAEEALQRYKAMVANAEAELEEEHRDLEQKLESKELEDWEKALLLEDDGENENEDDQE